MTGTYADARLSGLTSEALNGLLESANRLLQADPENEVAVEMVNLVVAELDHRSKAQYR